MPDADGGWRLFEPRDAPFVYELVTKVDPRWWRFSRHGLEPSQLLEIVKGIAAGVIVFDGSGDSVACAVLAEAGSSGTGMFELYALPNAHAHLFARRFAPELIAAAFAGAPIRRLYHERFENDPVLLGDVAHLFEVEVTYPEFALVEGIYERRTTSVLTAPGFAAWQQAQQ
jgi:hypothetical protein